MSRVTHRVRGDVGRSAQHHIVAATTRDSLAIAELIDLAGEGIPHVIWRAYAPAEQDALHFGAQRAAVGSGHFSWRNVHLLKDAKGIAGMLLAYRLTDSAPDFTDLHPLEYALVNLEAKVPGTFYINALAVYPTAQGMGYGCQLMAHAHQLARTAGCSRSSLIVFAHNTKARALYHSLGYVEHACHSPLDHPLFHAYGECLLLVRESH